MNETIVLAKLHNNNNNKKMIVIIPFQFPSY